jgi:hypothetical protein
MVTIRLILISLVVLSAVSLGIGLQRDYGLRPSLNRSDQLSQWDLDGSGSWDISDGKLMLVKAGTPSGPIRRPAALAILKTDPFRRVMMEVDLRSTAPLNVERRDLDLVCGYESPTRFYYVHLSGVTDDVHNGIFLVADADRRRIDSGKGNPPLKDQQWHKARLERDGATGRIDVYIGNDKTPALSAVDSTILKGRVGVGSFDDTGEFRKIVITGSND